MRIKLLLTVIALLTMVGRAHADNLSVGRVTMKPGETKQLEISLVNPDKQYTAFQFDLQLPEGISIAKNDKGKLVASLSESRKDDHAFAVTAQANNTYRFLAYSLSNAVFSGTSGTLVSLSISSDQALEDGVIAAAVKAQVFTDAGGDQSNWDDVAFNITIATPQVPVITADNKSRVYGEDNPAFTYTSDIDITGTPELTCEATKTSSAGTYDILVNRGTVEGDYSSAKGVLTITKAALTIGGGTYTITQGDDLPTFVAEYAGFKNDETASVLTKAPTLTTTATPNSAPGTYDVVVSGAEAENYDITYQTGTLTINKAPATEKLVVDEVTMPADATKQIAINLVNPDKQFTAFQFDLQLPEGISIAKNDKGKFVASLSDSRKDDHYFAVSVQADNTYRFLAYSMSNAVFSGASGALVNVSISSDQALEDGVKVAILKAQVFTDAAGNQYNREDVAFSITIATPIVPVITADKKSREYGEDNPVFTYTSDIEITGTPELTCEATKTSSVGTYDILVNRGTVEGDYSSAKGILTITKAALTISGGTYTITQGDALPTFVAEYVGFKNDETASVLTKAPTLTTTATSNSAPGTYDVVVSGAEAENYNITYQTGTLTINKAPATEKLVVDDITMPADATKQIAINMVNPERYFAAFQFDMELPEGITFAKNDKNKFIVSLNEERIDDHSISVSAIGSNTYRFLAYSMSNAQISGTSGTLLSISVCSDDNVTDGVKIATLKNLVFTDVNSQQFNLDETSFKINIVTPVITAVNKTRVYGEENPELTFTTTSEFIGTPELSTSAVATSPVGSYDIVVNRGTVEGKYTGVNGKLTITVKTVDNPTITLSNTSYTFDGNAKEPTVTVKDGDTIIPAAEYTVSYSNNTNVGTATVTITDVEGGNYAVSGSATFTIEKDYTIGDVDGDGVIDLADAVLVINHYVGKPVAKFNEKAADVDGDNVIDLADAVRIINYYVGKVQSLEPDGLDPQ